jgi:hypothetical protein
VLTHDYRASIATIARFPYIHGFNDRADFLFTTTGVAILSCCEIGLSIIAASCATLRPLLRQLIPSQFLANSSSRSCSAKHTLRLDGPGQYGRSKRGYKRSDSHGGTERLALDALQRQHRLDTPVLRLDIPSRDRDQDTESNSSKTKFFGTRQQTIQLQNENSDV